MKVTTFLLIILFALQAQAQTQAQNQTQAQTQAQTTPPKHFHPGRIQLPDSSILTGYIRDYLRANASIVFLDPRTGNKHSFTGAQLLSVDIDTVRFICLKGDFFRVIATSNSWFLQKASDASSKPAYNGTEPILTNGTAGRLNDYFLYDPARQTLQLVNNKTMATLIPTAFFKQR